MRCVACLLAALLVVLSPVLARAEEDDSGIAAVLVAYEALMMDEDDAVRRAGIAGLADALPDRLRETWESRIQPGIDAILDENSLKAAELFTQANNSEVMVNHPALQAFALRLAGRSYNAAGQHEEALAAFQDIWESYGGGASPAVAHQTALARSHHAATLAALTRNEEDRDAAIAAYRETVKCLAGVPHKAVRRVAAATLFTMAMLLEEWDRNRESVWAFDEFESEYPEYASREAMPALAREAWHYADLGPASVPATGNPGIASSSREPEMLLMQAQARLNAGAPDEAIAMYDVIIGSADDGEDAPTFLTILHAMLGKGRALEIAGDAWGAIAVYEELFALHAGEGETDADRLAVLALTACGTVHGRLGDDRAALDAFSRMLARFENGNDDIVMAQVASVLMLSAKIAFELNEVDASVAYLDRLAAWSALRPGVSNPHRDEAMELRMAIDHTGWTKQESPETP